MNIYQKLSYINQNRGGGILLSLDVLLFQPEPKFFNVGAISGKVIGKQRMHNSHGDTGFTGTEPLLIDHTPACFNIKV